MRPTALALSAVLLMAGAAPRALAASDRLDAPLTATPGDVQRGRQIVASRQTGLCLLCHQAPLAEAPFQGTVATDLAGTGLRWTAGQLRQRIVDSRALNPDSLMPAFHRTTDLQRVGAAFQGQPILDAQQVEDVVAFLQTLRESAAVMTRTVPAPKPAR
jgi:L-cysteine S-thiosulfotransferase